MYDAGQNVRKLVKDGFVIRKPVKIHSRARARAAQEAKSKGRHTGYGELQTASAAKYSLLDGKACTMLPVLFCSQLNCYLSSTQEALCTRYSLGRYSAIAAWPDKASIQTLDTPRVGILRWSGMLGLLCDGCSD